MSKGCARSSKKECGDRAAGPAVRIDEHSGARLAPSQRSGEKSLPRRFTQSPVYWVYAQLFGREFAICP